jgi:hypothetical protein
MGKFGRVGVMLAVGVTLATALTFGLVSSPTAGAATSKNVFDVHVGDNFIPPLADPDVAMAASGETTAVVVTGLFDVAAKTASGSGTFVHRASDGTVVNSGTLTITGLRAFQFFGCGFTPDGGVLPSNFCGGRAILTMVAHPAPGVNVDAILTVTCDLTGGGSPPPGQPEGVTVVVPGHLNFNKSVSGSNLFVEH